MKALNLTLENKNIRIAAVLMIAAMLMSCGASKSESGSSEDASRITGNISTPNPAKPLAYCNQATDTSNTTRVNMAAFTDMYGQVDPNFVHLKVTNLPAGFKDNTTYFSLWKWYAESNGFSYVYPTPLSFKLIKIQTGEELTGSITQLSWSTIATLASGMSVTTPAEFFQKVRLFVSLQDPTAQYDAITVGVHDITSGNTINRIDALLPVFAADPRQYAVESSGDARATVLQRIHPFYSADYSLWSANTFGVKANEFCAALTQY